MKAILLNNFGDASVLNWEEVPTPSIGPAEVLVAVQAVSVNRTLDLHIREHGGNYGVELPLVLGVDPSGIVVEVGEGVDEPKVNDRVTIFRGFRCGVCPQCSAGNFTQCQRPRMVGVHVWGGYAEFLRAPAINCVPIPDELSFPMATVITRHFPLAFGEVRLGGLQPGGWALVMGAAGGLGSCVVQVARDLGARVIAAAGADDRVAAACSLGAEFGINYRKQDLEKEVDRITGGEKVDVVFDNIGDPTLWDGAYNSLARGGTLVTAGAHGGGLVNIDLRRLYQERLKVVSGLGDDRLEDLKSSLKKGVTGEFKVLIDRVMPLSRAADAHRIVEEQNPIGKVVLDPSQQ